MKAILGTKLGMTQVFDPETGGVDARHRDRGRPVPGRRRCRTAETDGYEAVQLAFERGRRAQAHEGRARPPEEGRRRPRTATSSSSAGPTRAASRRDRHRRGVRARRRGQGLRHLDRQGLRRARSSATTSAAARRRTARTTSAQPGSIGASATPVARLQGHEMAGPHGRQARHPARARSSTASTPSATCCSSRAPCPGPKSGIVEIREAS